MDDRNQVMSEATRWLLEMEVLNIPYMKSTLILNICKVSPHIDDTEVLVDEYGKKMLIFLRLRGFGKMFRKREISQAVLGMLQEVLPSFQFRVTFDEQLFHKAVKGLKAQVDRRQAQAEAIRKILDEKKRLVEAAAATKAAAEKEVNNKPTEGETK